MADPCATASDDENTELDIDYTGWNRPTTIATTEPVHVNLAGRWRVGRKVGRAIYAVIDYQREQIRLAFDPLLTPYVAPGHVYTPQEQYVRRLRSLGYGA